MSDTSKKGNKTMIVCLLVIAVCVVLCVLIALQSNRISGLEQQNDPVFASQQQSLNNAIASQKEAISQQNSQISENNTQKDKIKKQIASYENEIAKSSTKN